MTIGLGTWGLGGKDYKKISKNNSRIILTASYKSGIRFFDTAPLYGDGRSEVLLGELAQSVGRKNIIISTKCGMLPHKGFDLKQDFSINNILKDLINSMERLKTDYIDFFLLHSPEIHKINLNEIIELMMNLKRNKIIKYYGISLRSPLDYKKLKDYNLDAIEFNFNLFDQRALEINLFKDAKSRGIKTICRTPLCFGFLSNKVIRKVELHKQDHRKLNWSNNQFKAWVKAKQYFSNFYDKKIYEDFSQFALNFCNSYNFDYVIPGLMSKKDLNLAVKSSLLKNIKKNILEDIFKIYKKKKNNIFITKK